MKNITLNSQKTFFISANGENLNNKELTNGKQLRKKIDFLAFYPRYKASYTYTWMICSLLKKESKHDEYTEVCEVDIYISCNDYAVAARLAKDFVTAMFILEQEKRDTDLYFVPSIQFHSLEEIKEIKDQHIVEE